MPSYTARTESRRAQRCARAESVQGLLLAMNDLPLSPREKMLLRRMAKGWSIAKIRLSMGGRMTIRRRPHRSNPPTFDDRAAAIARCGGQQLQSTDRVPARVDCVAYRRPRLFPGSVAPRNRH